MCNERNVVGGWSVLGGRGSPKEVAALFLRLRLIAFGGPAANISMMRDGFVIRRKWVSERHFLDLLGATNLIPGPNATEMAIHLSLTRAGWAGLVVSGALVGATWVLLITSAPALL